MSDRGRIVARRWPRSLSGCRRVLRSGAQGKDDDGSTAESAAASSRRLRQRIVPLWQAKTLPDDRRGAPSMILHPPPRPSPRDGPCKPRPGPAKHPTIDGAVVNGRREAGRLGGLGKMGALWVLPAQSTRQLQRGKDAVERPLERSAWLNSWTSTLEQLPALSSSLWTYAPILCA